MIVWFHLLFWKGLKVNLTCYWKSMDWTLLYARRSRNVLPPLSEEEVFDLPSLPHVGCFSGRWGKAEYVTGSFKVGLEFALRSFEDKTVLFTRARNRYTLDSCYFWGSQRKLRSFVQLSCRSLSIHLIKPVSVTRFLGQMQPLAVASWPSSCISFILFSLSNV